MDYAEKKLKRRELYCEQTGHSWVNQGTTDVCSNCGAWKTATFPLAADPSYTPVKRKKSLCDLMGCDLIPSASHNMRACRRCKCVSKWNAQAQVWEVVEQKKTPPAAYQFVQEVLFK